MKKWENPKVESLGVADTECVIKGILECTSCYNRWSNIIITNDTRFICDKCGGNMKILIQRPVCYPGNSCLPTS